jgi:hypothetical protein
MRQFRKKYTKFLGFAPKVAPELLDMAASAAMSPRLERTE